MTDRVRCNTCQGVRVVATFEKDHDGNPIEIECPTCTAPSNTKVSPAVEAAAPLSAEVRALLEAARTYMAPADSPEVRAVAARIGVVLAQAEHGVGGASQQVKDRRMVRKRAGYPFVGLVESEFTTVAGARVVVNMVNGDGAPTGLLHIFAEDQVEVL